MPHAIVMDPLASQQFELKDIIVHDGPLPSPAEVIEAHEHDLPDHQHHGMPSNLFTVESLSPVLEVAEPTHELQVEENLPEGADVVIMHDEGDGHPEVIAAIDFGDLPGAPHSPEPIDIEVEEESEEDSKSSDSNSSSDSDSNDLKKKDKWDWKSKGFGHFTVWVKERFDSVPKHSGYDVSGLERAHAYLEKLHSEISKAMRADLDGELEAESVANLHEKIEEGMEKLKARMEKVKTTKKKSDEDNDKLVKEAQKIFGVQNGVVIAVPLFISSLARAITNGMISGGHDMEDMYFKLVKKFKLSERERMELIQLLQDMGLPMIKDRGLLPEEGFDPRSSDNFDFGANYQA